MALNASLADDRKEQINCGGFGWILGEFECCPDDLNRDKLL